MVICFPQGQATRPKNNWLIHRQSQMVRRFASVRPVGFFSAQRVGNANGPSRKTAQRLLLHARHGALGSLGSQPPASIIQHWAWTTSNVLSFRFARGESHKNPRKVWSGFLPLANTKNTHTPNPEKNGSLKQSVHSTNLLESVRRCGFPTELAPLP